VNVAIGVGVGAGTGVADGPGVAFGATLGLAETVGTGEGMALRTLLWLPPPAAGSQQNRDQENRRSHKMSEKLALHRLPSKQRSTSLARRTS
jgi:hypothetical protein